MGGRSGRELRLSRITLAIRNSMCVATNGGGGCLVIGGLLVGCTGREAENEKLLS